MRALQLVGMSISDARAVDDVLSKLEHEHMAPTVRLAASMACHQASAAEKYEHPFSSHLRARLGLRCCPRSGSLRL